MPSLLKTIIDLFKNIKPEDIDRELKNIQTKNLSSDEINQLLIAVVKLKNIKLFKGILSVYGMNIQTANQNKSNLLMILRKNIKNNDKDKNIFVEMQDIVLSNLRENAVDFASLFRFSGVTATELKSTKIFKITQFEHKYPAEHYLLKAIQDNNLENLKELIDKNDNKHLIIKQSHNNIDSYVNLLQYAILTIENDIEFAKRSEIIDFLTEKLNPNFTLEELANPIIISALNGLFFKKLFNSADLVNIYTPETEDPSKGTALIHYLIKFGYPENAERIFEIYAKKHEEKLKDLFMSLPLNSLFSEKEQVESYYKILTKLIDMPEKIFLEEDDLRLDTYYQHFTYLKLIGLRSNSYKDLKWDSVIKFLKKEATQLSLYAGVFFGEITTKPLFALLDDKLQGKNQDKSLFSYYEKILSGEVLANFIISSVSVFIPFKSKNALATKMILGFIFETWFSENPEQSIVQNYFSIIGYFGLTYFSPNLIIDNAFKIGFISAQIPEFARLTYHVGGELYSYFNTNITEVAGSQNISDIE